MHQQFPAYANRLEYKELVNRQFARVFRILVAVLPDILTKRQEFALSASKTSYFDAGNCCLRGDNRLELKGVVGHAFLVRTWVEYCW